MKKIFSLVLALSLLLALSAPAYADLLWEPNNRFYEKHRNACEYVGRSFYANGPDGFVTLLDAPDSSGVAAQYENGTRLHVYWQYRDWGCISRETIDGWVPMAQLSLIYDNISFEEEYGSQIQSYNGQFAHYDGGADCVNFFAYPGAPEIQATLSRKSIPDLLENLTGAKDGNSYISQIFVDEDGRTWGFVIYMYGRLNAWFCLDDPSGTDFPVRDVSTQALVPAQTPVLPTAAYLPYILVAAVVAVTAGLLFWFYRRPKRGK